MSWKFVYKNGGWWLKISSLEELMAYQKETQLKNPLARGFRSVLNCREFGRPVAGEPIRPHVNNEGYTIGLKAETEGVSLFRAAAELAVQMDEMQVNALKNGESIYFNRMGGWHSTKNRDYTQWYEKEKMIFPDFKTNQIKVEKYPLGNHYYAYIDSMQVRDGDTLKWNTYEEAYNMAKVYCEE